MKMRRFFSFTLVLALALSLCGCGKNEMVLSVEHMIAEIGEAVPENRESIAAARVAYDVLTPKLQAKVENAGLLFEAEKTLADLETQEAAARAEVCQWLGGEWVDVSSLLLEFYGGYEKAVEKAAENGVAFFEDGTCVARSIHGSWEYQDGIVTACGTEFTLDESQGYLMLKADDLHILVRRDLLEDVFVTVELTEENVDTYIRLADMPYRKYDEFFQYEGDGSWPWLASRVYKDGLILLTERDLYIEISNGQVVNANEICAFGPLWDSYVDMDYLSQPFDSSDCSFGRVKGTLHFVKSQYAQFNVTGGVRNVRVLGVGLDRWHDPEYMAMMDSLLYY